MNHIDAKRIADKLITNMRVAAYQQGYNDGYKTNCFFNVNRIFILDNLQLEYDKGRHTGALVRLAEDRKETGK